MKLDEPGGLGAMVRGVEMDGRDTGDGRVSREVVVTRSAVVLHLPDRRINHLQEHLDQLTALAPSFFIALDEYRKYRDLLVSHLQAIHNQKVLEARSLNEDIRRGTYPFYFYDYKTAAAKQSAVSLPLVQAKVDRLHQQIVALRKPIRLHVSRSEEFVGDFIDAKLVRLLQTLKALSVRMDALVEQCQSVQVAMTDGSTVTTRTKIPFSSDPWQEVFTGRRPLMSFEHFWDAAYLRAIPKGQYPACRKDIVSVLSPKELQDTSYPEEREHDIETLLWNLYKSWTE